MSVRITLVSAIVLFASLLPASHGADILDKMNSSLSRSLEVIKLENAHEVAEVRQAIADCRAGNYKIAIPVLETYTEKGDVGATFVLARLYSDGLGVEASVDKAIKLYQINADEGHTPSMLMIASLKEKDDPAEALQLIKMAASLDDVGANLRLGYAFERGKLGAKSNPKLAVNYYKKVMELGHPAGKFELARCLDLGVGVSPDAIQSTRYYMQSAMAGYAKAQMMMATRYFEGKGMEKDPVAALGWLTKASQNGSTEAMVVLGQRYENGEIIAKDLNAAGQLYSKAAKLGDPTGRYHLGLMYLNGVGTQPDPIRAYVLLSKTQALPRGKKLFEALSEKLTPEQIELAKKKIAEGKGN